MTIPKPATWGSDTAYAAPAGGRAAAIAYTLIETAKLNSVDTQTWLADTPDYKTTLVNELLPWN